MDDCEYCSLVRDRRARSVRLGEGDEILEQEIEEEIKLQIKHLADRLTECKMLLIYIVYGKGGVKEGKRVISILKGCRIEESNVMNQLLLRLQE